MAKKTVRWRANPKLVRVSIRRYGEGWKAMVQDRAGKILISRVNDSPRKAISLALKIAENHEMKGIDLAMQWAYEHPWKEEEDT